MLTEQPFAQVRTVVRDPLQLLRVIDGPQRGQRVGSAHDCFESFDVLTGESVQVWYRLLAQGKGYVWSCARGERTLSVTN